MRKTSGISLMILIFLSLCLITFSLLSLSSATADKTLSQKAADRTTEYYSAVNSANDILSKIDAALAQYLLAAEAGTESGETFADTENRTVAGQKSGGVQETAGNQETDDHEAEYLESCASISDIVPEASWTEGKITFSVPVNEDQMLQAELTVTYPQNEDDTLYRITAWETVNTREWTADKSMNVYRLDDIE